MKKILILIAAAALCACGGRYGAGIPAEYEQLLDGALTGCPRADSLRKHFHAGACARVFAARNQARNTSLRADVRAPTSCA